MTSTSKALNVVINGAAGQIAYALIPLLCNGQIFGPDVMVNLKLQEIPKARCRTLWRDVQLLWDVDCVYSPIRASLRLYEVPAGMERHG